MKFLDKTSVTLLVTRFQSRWPIEETGKSTTLHFYFYNFAGNKKGKDKVLFIVHNYNFPLYFLWFVFPCRERKETRNTKQRTIQPGNLLFSASYSHSHLSTFHNTNGKIL
jgi:hypothetical protein